MPTLLVIDDEESVRYSFRRVFGAEGVTVLTAATAAEGLAQLAEHAPDVVVLDLQLPDGRASTSSARSTAATRGGRSSSSRPTAPRRRPSRP